MICVIWRWGCVINNGKYVPKKCVDNFSLRTCPSAANNLTSVEKYEIKKMLTISSRFIHDCLFAALLPHPMPFFAHEAPVWQWGLHERRWNKNNSKVSSDRIKLLCSNLVPHNWALTAYSTYCACSPPSWWSTSTVISHAPWHNSTLLPYDRPAFCFCPWLLDNIKDGTLSLSIKQGRRHDHLDYVLLCIVAFAETKRITG